MAEVSIRLALEGRKKVEGDLTSVGRGFDTLSSRASSAGSVASTALTKLGSLGAGVARSLATTATAVGAVTAAATVSLVKTGVQYNNLEQNARGALTAILGTAPAADELLGRVRELAKTSPFPRQAFLTASQQLAGYGLAAEKIVPTLSAINEAAAATATGAEGIATMTDVLAKIAGQGKITGDEVARLGALGINAVQLISDATGKSMAETQKLISKGAINADQANEYLVAGINKRFAGASENVKKTWSGALDTVKGAWRDLGSAIVEPFISKGGGGLAVEWARSLGANLRVAANAAPGILALFQGKFLGAGATLGWEEDSKQVDHLMTAGENLRTTFRAVRGEVASWNVSLGASDTWTGRIVGATGLIRSGVEGILTRWNELQLGFSLGSKYVGDSDSAFTRLGGAVRGIVGAFQGFDWGSLGGVFKAFVGGDSGAMQANLAGIGASLRTLQPAFAAFASQAPSLNDVLGVFGSVLKFAANNVKFLTDHMGLIVGAFIAFKLAAVGANVAATVLRTTQIFVTATTLRQIGANNALAASNLQLAAAIRGCTVAELQANGASNAGLLTRIRSTAVMAAQKVALVAGAVATGVATAAQWVYNTSLTAGAAAMTALTWPVLLVVAAIALLVGGVILAYKHSDTFRGIVDGLWAKLKEAWAWIQGTAVPVMKVVFAAALDVAKAKFEQVRDTIGGFVDKLKGAWEWVKKLADRISDSALGKAISAVTGFVGGGGGVDGHAAAGGYMRRGQTFLVGEQGPELFTAGQAGTVLSHPATVAAVNANPMNFTRSEAPTQAELGSLRAPVEITVISELDGKVVAKSVAREFGNQMARGN